MKVMVLTPYLPHTRIDHGGGTAVRDLVRHLARRHEVLVAALIRPGEESRIDEVAAYGVKVAPLPFIDKDATGRAWCQLLGSRLGAGLRSLRSGFPHYVEKYWSRDLEDQLLQIVSEFQPDAIQVEYLQMSLYLRRLRESRDGENRPWPRIILNSHELGSIPRLRRAARASNDLLRRAHLAEANQWRKLQNEACRWADRVLCVTDEDRLAYENDGGSNLLTVPLGMDLAAIRPERAPQGQQCLFVGSFGHRPNVLAARLLVREIWPLVRKEIPKARLVIAGRGSDTFLAKERIDKAGIKGVGFVADLGRLFRESRLFLAPLPEGGGIKIKILEAMARGIPVVTTNIGAEGITTAADRTLWLAPANESFAITVVQALKNPQAEEMGKRARHHVEQFFGWDAIVGKLESIYLDRF